MIYANKLSLVNAAGTPGDSEWYLLFELAV